MYFFTVVTHRRRGIFGEAVAREELRKAIKEEQERRPFEVTAMVLLPEHMIRDEDDFRRHVNYIHYNPVKHRLASCPHAWEYSSFHGWAAEGFYRQDWLCGCRDKKVTIEDMPELECGAGE